MPQETAERSELGAHVKQRRSRNHEFEQSVGRHTQQGVGC